MDFRGHFAFRMPEPDGRQHGRMGLGARDVLGCQTFVEADRDVDAFHDRGRAAGETPAPELVGGSPVRTGVRIGAGGFGRVFFGHGMQFIGGQGEERGTGYEKGGQYA